MCMWGQGQGCNFTLDLDMKASVWEQLWGLLEQLQHRSWEVSNKEED